MQPVTVTETIQTKAEKQHPPMRIVWRNVALFVYLHIASLFGVYLAVTSAKWQTNVFAIFYYFISGLGITAGAHRLWSHKSYKAKWPLKVLLVFMETCAFQNHIFEWSRDHRVHHKYSETDADPHNATRGFFFAHIGWLLVRKHPDVITKGKTVDLSDLEADTIVQFQKKFYSPLVIVCCFVIPTMFPHWAWGESYLNAFLIAGLLRYCACLNATWLINSAAHMWGNRPYDRNINPRENPWVTFSAMGEGFHNYHHTFPWDYATSEYGWKLNLTTSFINFFAWLGLAYDLKRVSPEMVMQRRMRTGEKAP